MDPVIVSVFGLVYLGMFLGEIPGLKLDRPGIALLGAIALVASGRLPSIANIIVVDQARRHGVEIHWRTHARVGMPVTLATLALAALWLIVIA